MTEMIKLIHWRLQGLLSKIIELSLYYYYILNDVLDRLALNFLKFSNFFGENRSSIVLPHALHHEFVISYIMPLINAYFKY